MALCIAAGKDAQAYGICCVAVGDNCRSFGAFQIVSNDALNIPTGYSNKQLQEYLGIMKLNLEAYRCMEVQKHAPVGFYDKAENALKPLMSKLENMIKDGEEKEKPSDLQ